MDLQCYIYGAKDITLQWKNSAVSSEVKDSSVWSFTNYGVQDSKQWISAVGGREWETLRVEVTANRFSRAPRREHFFQLLRDLGACLNLDDLGKSVSGGTRSIHVDIKNYKLM